VRLRARLEAPQRVDHRVADEANPGGVDPLDREVGRGLGAVREEDVGQPVGEDAVDLLGHRPVERAQPGLDVRDRDAELGGREGDGERRVDVTAHAHQIGLLLEQHALERLERPRSLHAVRPGADTEEDVGLGELEVRQHLRRHPLVVVLPGMDDALRDVAAVLERGDDRRHLHEVRARANDVHHGPRPHCGPTQPQVAARRKAWWKACRFRAKAAKVLQDGCQTTRDA
jgi:hypothetical protein